VSDVMPLAQTFRETIQYEYFIPGPGGPLKRYRPDWLSVDFTGKDPTLDVLETTTTGYGDGTFLATDTPAVIHTLGSAGSPQKLTVGDRIDTVLNIVIPHGQIADTEVEVRLSGPLSFERTLAMEGTGGVVQIFFNGDGVATQGSNSQRLGLGSLSRSVMSADTGIIELSFSAFVLDSEAAVNGSVWAITANLRFGANIQSHAVPVMIVLPSVQEPGRLTVTNMNAPAASPGDVLMGDAGDVLMWKYELDANPGSALQQVRLALSGSQWIDFEAGPNATTQSNVTGEAVAPIVTVHPNGESVEFAFDWQPTSSTLAVIYYATLTAATRPEQAVRLRADLTFATSSSSPARLLHTNTSVVLQTKGFDHSGLDDADRLKLKELSQPKLTTTGDYVHQQPGHMTIGEYMTVQMMVPLPEGTVDDVTAEFQLTTSTTPSIELMEGALAASIGNPAVSSIVVTNPAFYTVAVTSTTTTVPANTTTTTTTGVVGVRGRRVAVTYPVLQQRGRREVGSPSSSGSAVQFTADTLVNAPDNVWPDERDVLVIELTTFVEDVPTAGNGDTSTLSGSIVLGGIKIDFPLQTFTVVEPEVEAQVAFEELPSTSDDLMVNVAVTVTMAHSNLSLAPAAAVSLGFSLNSTFSGGSSAVVNSSSILYGVNGAKDDVELDFVSITTAAPVTTTVGVEQNPEVLCNAELLRLEGGSCLNGGKCTMVREDCSNSSSSFTKPVCDCNPAHTAGAAAAEVASCFYDQFCGSKVDCSSKEGSTHSCNLVDAVKAGKDPAPIICKEEPWPIKLCSAEAPSAISLIEAPSVQTPHWALNYVSNGLPNGDLAVDGVWTSTMVLSMEKAMLEHTDRACINVEALWSQPQPGATVPRNVRQYTHADAACYQFQGIGKAKDNSITSTTIAAFIAGPLILVLVLGLITVQHKRRQAGKLADGVVDDDAIAKMDPYAKGGRPIASADRKSSASNFNSDSLTDSRSLAKVSGSVHGGRKKSSLNALANLNITDWGAEDAELDGGEGNYGVHGQLHLAKEESPYGIRGQITLEKKQRPSSEDPYDNNTRLRQAPGQSEDAYENNTTLSKKLKSAGKAGDDEEPHYGLPNAIRTTMSSDELPVDGVGVGR
jgi:hypothetical protein